MAIPRWIGQLILDVLSLFLVFLPWIVLQTAVKPYRRGFFCDDDSIKYPFKDNTVTNAALTISGFVVAFIVFAVTEAVQFLAASNRPAPFRFSSSCSMPRYFLIVYKIFGIFLFGLAIQQTITNIGKFTIGRLRPHFLSVCDPDFSRLNCTVGNAADPVYLYIEYEVCRTPESSTRLKDARMSFPSGHSSFATYVAVFLTLYLQARMTWKGSKLLKHLLQAILIYLAIFVCLSRVSDYKHHWSDVLSGAILGVFVAALAGIHISSQFRGYCRKSLPSLTYEGDSRAADANEAPMA